MEEEMNEEMPEERWAPIPGFEGWYDASDLGNVRRMKAYATTFIGRILKVDTSADYYRVTLSKNNEQHRFTVHGLVAMTFLGDCPDGKQINHIDGVKTNNRADNLEYVTSSENQQHAYDTNLRIPPRGETQGLSKLTEKNVHEMRSLFGLEPYKTIAARFGVTASNVCMIATGRSWAWLKEEGEE